jgi:transposase
MIGLPPSVKIFVRIAPCDMRKQMDGLAALVQQGMEREPRSGDMYVFCNRRRDMLKVLFFDQQGYCLLAKRMDKGTFKLTADGDAPLQLSAAEFGQLMAGIAIVKAAHAA